MKCKYCGKEMVFVDYSEVDVEESGKMTIEENYECLECGTLGIKAYEGILKKVEEFYN